MSGQASARRTTDRRTAESTSLPAVGRWRNEWFPEGTVHDCTCISDRFTAEVHPADARRARRFRALGIRTPDGLLASYPESQLAGSCLTLRNHPRLNYTYLRLLLNCFDSLRCLSLNG